MPGTNLVVETVEDLARAPEEFRVAVEKIVISHAINELYGVRVYDEPAIAFAPNPYAKWLTIRIVMEEYGHHVRFFELGRQMGIAKERMMPGETAKSPLTIFGYDMRSWTDFVAVKLFGDLAEILQVEDLLQCPFHPLRNAARLTMPEERFHAQFGLDYAKEICATSEGKERLQTAVNNVFPIMPSFFGRDKSRNNEIYRKWKIKVRTNEDMREDYINRSRERAEGLGLTLPPVLKAA